MGRVLSPSSLQRGSLWEQTGSAPTWKRAWAPSPPSLRCLFTQVRWPGRQPGGPGLQAEAGQGGAGCHPGAQPPQPKLTRAPLWRLPRTAP